MPDKNPADNSSLPFEPSGVDGYVRYTGSIPFEDLPFPMESDNSDFDWAWNNQELRTQFAGKVIAVHDRTVWGVGKSMQAAWDEARKKENCPAASEFAFVPML